MQPPAIAFHDACPTLVVERYAPVDVRNVAYAAPAATDDGDLRVE
jgi:hypothetical protein